MTPLISLPLPLPARLCAVALLPLLLVATPAGSAGTERFDPTVSGQFGASPHAEGPANEAPPQGDGMDLAVDEDTAGHDASTARSQQNRRRQQAQAALNRNEPAEALQLATQALRASPNDARLRFIRGVALRRLKRLPEAEKEFRLLIEEYPELPEPYNNLAVVLAAQGRLDDAREALQGAIHALPGYALAHENLGDLYLQQARDAWQKALQLDPRNPRLTARLNALKSAERLSTVSDDTRSSSRRSP